jgi:hypothetical protein
MTLGLSISGAVFINTAKQGLIKALPNIPVDQISQMVAGASNNVIKSLSDELRIVAFEVIVSSWQKTFICVYVGAAVSFLASLFMNVSLHQPTAYCHKRVQIAKSILLCRMVAPTSRSLLEAAKLLLRCQNSDRVNQGCIVLEMYR